MIKDVDWIILFKSCKITIKGIVPSIDNVQEASGEEEKDFNHSIVLHLVALSSSLGKKMLVIG